MKKLILMCGKTHSGKTTFGKRLAEKMDRSIVIDNDEIELIIKNNFNILFNDPMVLAKSSPEHPTLHLRVQRLIAAYALEIEVNPILTASHTKKLFREIARNIAKENDAKFILIYMNLENNIIEENIKISNRPTETLRETNDFLEVLKKQNAGVFESPTEEEADYYFEVKNYNEAENIMDQIIKI